MKKCPVCLFGTWVVGLSAVAWGASAIRGQAPALVGATYVAAFFVALTGIGFLVYQPPFKPCPRCVKASTPAAK